MKTSTKQRNKRQLRLEALATAILGVGVIASIALPRPAVAAAPAPASILNFVSKWAGNKVGVSVMEEMGYKCAANTPFSCYLETSYDPPRWGKGTVQTGNGPGGYARARGWPGTDAPITNTFPEGRQLNIFCQTQGPWIYGRWGWTNVWDYVGHHGESPMFVSDGFVYTGTNGFVAGSCSSTNFGGDPFAGTK